MGCTSCTPVPFCRLVCFTTSCHRWHRGVVSQPSVSTPFRPAQNLSRGLLDEVATLVFNVSSYLMAPCAKLFQRHSQRQWIATCWVCRWAVLVSWGYWVPWVYRHLAAVCFSPVNVQSRNLKHSSAAFPPGQRRPLCRLASVCLWTAVCAVEMPAGSGHPRSVLRREWTGAVWLGPINSFCSFIENAVIVNMLV